MAATRFATAISCTSASAVDVLLNVLLVASKYLPEYTGAAHRLHQMYRRLAADKGTIRVRVMCNAIEYAGNSEYMLDGISVRRIAPTMFRNWRKIPFSPVQRLALAAKSYQEAFATLRVLKQGGYDVIHTVGMSGSTAMAIRWATGRRMPLLIELVTAGARPDQYLPGLQHFTRLDLRHRVGIVAISRDLGDVCGRFGLGRNTWVRPNAVDESRFFPPSPGRRTELRLRHTHFAPEDKLLVTVAKFMPQKNQLFLVDVLSRLPERYKLVLAGPVVSGGPLHSRDAEYLDDIKTRIHELGLEGRVKVQIGFVDAAHYMQLADVYLMPNRQEGLGTPMLESMACGVPVVANRNVPPFREWIRQGENGYCQPLEVDAWVDAIEAAVRFEEKDRLRTSEQIIKHAGSARIDAGYRRLLEQLVSIDPDEALDVQSVLA